MTGALWLFWRSRGGDGRQFSPRRGIENYGPLAFDDAIDPEAAKIKGIESPVAGRSQILVVPNLEAANMLAKNVVRRPCRCRLAGEEPIPPLGSSGEARRVLPCDPYIPGLSFVVASKY
jgi:Phosphate acetyl/butaryl transferase